MYPSGNGSTNSSSSAGRPLTILLVEDEAAHIKLIRRAFETGSLPVRLVQVNTLAEARRALSDRIPELVITDILLPDGRGLDLLQKASHAEAFPVIVMTSHGDEEVAVRSLKAGALDYVVKSPQAFAAMPRIAERILREWQLIVERKQAERALRESEARFRQMAENIKEVFWLRNRERLLYVSPAYEEVWGRSCRGIYEDPHSFFSAVHPEDREQVRKTLTWRRFEDNGFADEEFRIIRPDGQIRWIWARVFPVMGQPDEKRTVGIAEDITERRQAQEDVRKLAAIVASSDDAIISMSLDGVIRTWNAGAEKMYGYPADEALDRHVSLIVPEGRQEEIRRVLENTGRGVQTAHLEMTHLSRDGRMIPVSLTFSPVKDRYEQVVGISTIARDNTLRNRLENQLRQAQKMEALGTLAGGIAHDFNNILFPIIGYAEMARDDLPENSYLRKNLGAILKAAYRARNLVQQILTFSRQTEHDIKPIRIQPVIKEVLKFLRASLPANIDIHQEIDGRCGPVLADPTHIYQIVMNLSTNAFHAMQESGGTLHVRLCETELTPEQAAEKNLEPGSHIRLTVQDTGVGMAPDVLEHIFEPYFTTKDKSKGTGLGLSLVHGIVKSCGGEITVRSRTGEGTRFRIYLPRIEIADEDQLADAENDIPRGHEHILLVDDEVAILEMEQQMLERLGYQVTVQPDSREALHMFRREPERYDLLMTDMAMPGMTGLQLVGEVLQLRPEMPIVLCSGFSDRDTEEKALGLGVHAVMTKPVLKNVLASTIREVLEQVK